jgi:hypothetical protein
MVALQLASLAGLAAAAHAVPNGNDPYWATQPSMEHSEIAWSFDTLEHGALPKAHGDPNVAALRSERRRMQIGPPPVNFDTRAITWNERTFFLLNNYHSGMPHSCAPFSPMYNFRGYK